MAREGSYSNAASDSVLLSELTLSSEDKIHGAVSCQKDLHDLEIDIRCKVGEEICDGEGKYVSEDV